MRVSLLGMLTGLALLAAPTAHAQLITGFDEFTDGQAAVVFNQPSFSGSTAGQLAAAPNASTVSTAQAFSGDKSLKVEWAWLDENPAKWLRLTTFNAPTLPNPTIDLTQAVAMKVFVEGQAPLGFALGVRETGTTAAIGANGGASGGIEFIGSTTTGTPPTPTASRIIAPGSWQDLVFVLPSELVTPFAGATANGILTAANNKGVLEHLAIRSQGVAGPYTLYIDDLRVVAPEAIPEPGSMALLASGLLPLLALRRRTR